MILQFDLGEVGLVEINLDRVSNAVAFDGKMAANVPLVALRKLLSEQIEKHGWDRTVSVTAMTDMETAEWTRELEKKVG